MSSCPSCLSSPSRLCPTHARVDNHNTDVDAELDALTDEVRGLLKENERLRDGLRVAEHFLENVRQYGALRSEVDVPKLFHALGHVRAALSPNPNTKTETTP